MPMEQFEKKSLVSKMVGFVKAKLEAKKIERLRREEEERQRAIKKKIDDFNWRMRRLLSMRDYMSEETYEKLSSYEEAVDKDPEALGAFAESKMVSGIIERLDSRQEMVQFDSAILNPHQRYETYSHVLLDTLGSQNVEPVLKQLINQRLVSAAPTAVGAGVLAHRRNAVGAAVMVAESARIGAHNGAVKAVFGEHIKQIHYQTRASEIPELQRLYIRYCHRLKFMGLGDRNIVSRALFALIYNNANATASTPTSNHKYSGDLPSVFHNSFGRHIWTVQAAVANLDQIRAKSDLNERLFVENNLMPFMKTMADFVPAPGFHKGWSL